VSVIREADSERPSGGLLGEQFVKLFEKHQLEGWPDEVPGVEAA